MKLQGVQHVVHIAGVKVGIYLGGRLIIRMPHCALHDYRHHVTSGKHRRKRVSATMRRQAAHIGPIKCCVVMLIVR